MQLDVAKGKTVGQAQDLGHHPYRPKQETDGNPPWNDAPRGTVMLHRFETTR